MLHTPLSEYLATSYRPDREYVDGEVKERNVGEYDHSRPQAAFFSTSVRAKASGVFAWCPNKEFRSRLAVLEFQTSASYFQTHLQNRYSGIPRCFVSKFSPRMIG